jgi:hypothetical protein
MLLQAKIPHKEFNAAVRDGSAEKKMKQILEETKAEAVYFTEYDGQRGAILIININDPSEVPNLRNHGFYHSTPMSISYRHDPRRIRAGRP